MTIACYVAVPVTAFRAPRAREYLETLPVPPPATVYGMLCSLVGEPDRLVHRGSELAVGVLDRGVHTRVLRTLWRVKDAKLEPGIDQNRRPDFQVLLTGVRFVVHVRPGPSEQQPSLSERLRSAFVDPTSVTRFGGLALGESTHLVDDVRPLRDDEDRTPVTWLERDAAGVLPLPVWVDHVGSAGTRYVQFRLHAADDPGHPPDAAWIAVSPETPMMR